MRVDSAVEPTKSENITVTWRRSARSSGEMPGALLNFRFATVTHGLGHCVLEFERGTILI
jgi:hypothetical protein